MSETALIVEATAAENYVSGWRVKHDPVAVGGIPGHITALFPFVPPGDFDDSTLRELRDTLASVEPFEYRLTRVDEFSGVVWLRPEPDLSFRSLTSRLCEAFPQFPPYGGRHLDPQPHLTLALVHAGSQQESLADRIRVDIDNHLPIACEATALSVFMSDDHGNWQREHTIGFGP